jgi:hypothetical protein
VFEKVPSKAWRPWISGSLNTKMDLKIPFAGGAGTGGGQVVTYYFVSDTKSKIGFWLGVNLFDIRPAFITEDIKIFADSCVDCTQQIIVSLNLKKSNPYLTVAANSSEVTSVTFSETRRFDFQVTSANLSLIIQKLQQLPNAKLLSSDPANYQVTSWNLNPEVWANATSDGWIGLSGKVLRTGPIN